MSTNSKYTLVLTFTSGKVSIITTEDKIAVDNLVALLTNTSSKNNEKVSKEWFSLKSVKDETFYIDFTDVVQAVIKKD